MLNNSLKCSYRSMPFTLEDAINLKNIPWIRSYFFTKPDLNQIYDIFDNPIIHTAIKSGDLEIINLFLEYAGNNPEKADIQIKNSHGCNMLMQVVHLPNLEEIIKLLLDAGVDCNNKSNSGETLLHALAHTNQLSTIELLLRSGANPNAIQLEDVQENLENITPAHYAALNDNREMVNLLAKYGADLTIKCKFIFDKEILWENTVQEIYDSKDNAEIDENVAEESYDSASNPSKKAKLSNSHEGEHDSISSDINFETSKKQEISNNDEKYTNKIFSIILNQLLNLDILPKWLEEERLNSAPIKSIIESIQQLIAAVYDKKSIFEITTTNFTYSENTYTSDIIEDNINDKIVRITSSEPLIDKSMVLQDTFNGSMILPTTINSVDILGSESFFHGYEIDLFKVGAI